MSSTCFLISDKARCFSQSERALYGNFIINADNIVGSIVHTWLNANKRTLNMTKTEFMLIRIWPKVKYRCYFHLNLNERYSGETGMLDYQSLFGKGAQIRHERAAEIEPMKQVATTKSLGITIDDKLSWNCHIEKLLTKKIALESVPWNVLGTWFLRRP